MSSSHIPWREWGDAAFTEARESDKPILLDIGAVWCHWCHVMDDGIPGDPVHTGTYATPEVQQRILANFIPIKVDNDRRPDINARYNMGGWPTTAFLTPDGDTLYGETYVTPSRMIGLLDHIADVYRNGKEQITAQAAEMRAQKAASEVLQPSDLDPNTTATVLHAIRRNFDSEFGGFGNQPKFPHPDALRFALEQYAATGVSALREIAEKTLHGMADGGMFDQYAGGFFRYSTTRDWSVPHFEKMLEDNAKLTSVYCLASSALDDSYYLDIVKSAHSWLLDEMRDPDTGAFAGSQDADKEEEYYGQPMSVRATLPTPYIDRTIYTGWNALMVSSLVARYRITGEEEILISATKAFDFLTRKMTQTERKDLPEMAVFYHFYTDGKALGSLGLLSDQIAMLHAALDLVEIGSSQEMGAAVEIANYLLLYLEDKALGGFYDLVPDPKAIGELSRPKKEISDNAEAALALMRLYGLTEETKYWQAAERALTLFADQYAAYGYFSASYARAVEAVTGPTLHITIVGDWRDPQTFLLQQTAWSHIAPGKYIETLTADIAIKQGLPADLGGQPYAIVCIGTVCHAPVSDVVEMLAQLRESHPSAN